MWGDLSTEAGLAEFDKFIATRTFVEGQSPTLSDAIVFSMLGYVPDCAKHPNAARYFRHLSDFTQHERLSFPMGSMLTFGSSSSATTAAAAAAAEPSAMEIDGIQFCSAVEKNKHPPWFRPRNGLDLGVRVHNTLTEGSKKDDLEPLIPGRGRRLYWYTCGPTVYDSCHMGHARAYLTFDILRRILEDYFGYEILYHINITDIDDKIIVRARRNKLIQEYSSSLLSSGKNGFETATKYISSQVEENFAKLKARKEKLAATVLDANTQKRERDELATQIKENELKLTQNRLVERKIAIVNTVATGKFQDAVTQLLKEASALGVKPADQTAEALAAALLNVISDTQTKIEELDAENESTSTQLSALQQKLAQTDSIRELAVCALQTKSASESDATTKSNNATLEVLVQCAREELGQRLDNERGDSVTDHSVFLAHARHFEQEYADDMTRLGIREPDVLTRVTEYLPQIVTFIQKIVENGFAYETAGNVYLDTEAFKASGHHYRKLQPFHGDTSDDALAESEGSLGATGTKKHKNDFALWKASKRGEPSWESPWGQGRPGWHIECSVVASDILGKNIDIHAGGVDLKFPHHDNELAQSEACFAHHQWVNYFFHAGHLHIKGLKMSKSLKNFITIRQALVEHSPRQLRLMFLLQPWDKPMNYSDQTVDDAKKKETLFKNYFGTIKHELRKNYLTRPVGWQNGQDDRDLMEFGLQTESRVREALCNNMDTVTAMYALCDLVTETNKYLARTPADKLCIPTLRKHAVFITKILRTFGVVDGADEIGFSAAGGEGLNREGVIAPVLDALVGFRDTVRDAARATKDVNILKACDQLRDSSMVDLGVRVEDDPNNGPSKWKLDDPNVLRQEMLDKQAKQKEAEDKKAAKALQKKKDDAAKLKEALLSPLDMFRGDASYSKFDETGMPTHDNAGAEVSKSAVKKLKKLHTAQEKSHGDLIAKFGSLEAAKAELAKLEAEIA